MRFTSSQHAAWTAQGSWTRSLSSQRRRARRHLPPSAGGCREGVVPKCRPRIRERTRLTDEGRVEQREEADDDSVAVSRPRTPGPSSNHDLSCAAASGGSWRSAMAAMASPSAGRAGSTPAAARRSGRTPLAPRGSRSGTACRRCTARDGLARHHPPPSGARAGCTPVRPVANGIGTAHERTDRVANRLVDDEPVTAGVDERQVGGGAVRAPHPARRRAWPPEAARWYA